MRRYRKKNSKCVYTREVNSEKTNYTFYDELAFFEERRIIAMARIQLKPINDLLAAEFNIPNYQRGYRWESEQVEDLLNDLKEFYIEKFCMNRNGKEIYCLQPLVVQKENNLWNVIDGQQRLTTIHILLSCLGQAKPYSLEYQTRKTSKQFLEDITLDNSATYQDNADFYYMHYARESISEWLRKNGMKLPEFLLMIKKRVNFIWYELDEKENPIHVFTRLNIGKIGLTESELVKALFLNRNNFDNKTKQKEKLLTLVEIANEWDQIEYRLQDDKFWLFFHETEYDKPTRIDFLLDLKYRMDELENGKYDMKMHPTFSYFYNAYVSSTDKLLYIYNTWNAIVSYFRIIEEWYNDEELFHYIGYLCTIKKEVADVLIKELLGEYSQCANKEEFVLYLKKQIKGLCKNCLDFDYIYEKEDENTKLSKTETKPLLLLHNIQTIIDQNESIKDDKRYSLPDFKRFPFHLFKKEHWDIEHIRPNSYQDFEGDRKKSERAKYIYVLRQSLEHDIESIVKDYDTNIKSGKTEEESFEILWNELNAISGKELSDLQKNKIWNYVLLDASTNREYGNACFSIKRDYVLKKEVGIKPKLTVDKNNGYKVIERDESEIAFVPVCTSSVFSKSYTQYPEDLRYWSERDAAYYRMDIEKRLWWYLKDGIKPKIEKKAYDELFAEYKSYIESTKNYEITMAIYVKEKEAGKIK